MLRKGTLIADRYEIIEKVGSGGMADVYRARCHKLNRFVAVKVLKQEFREDENFVSRFRIEAQSVAGLTHANIVNVYDVGDEAGIYYIVMEIVEGITLKNYIDKKGKLEPKEAVSIAIQVAQGIEAAHNHGIVHRDIKPQNIIISREGKVKVTDFGIARAASSNTINSNVMGSVHYISPEQARGGYSDYKSDIYSFGIMLFEMLTGKVPFEGDTTVSIALKHIQEEVPSVKSIDDSIPLAISQIVEKCTSKRKENRYESATALIVDLKKSLVDPEGIFVGVAAASSAVAAETKTVMITREEIAQIENATKNQATSVHTDNSINGSVAATALFNSNSKNKQNDYLEEDDEESENSTLDKVLLAIGVCAALIFLGIAIYFMVWMFGNVTPKTNNNTNTTTKQTQAVSDGKVEIPPIVGMDGTEAKKILNERGLGYVVTETVSSDLHSVGKVITQSLESGTRVNPNTTVYVTVSSGPEEFVLEDYSGREEEEIKDLLTDTYGLEVECQYEFNDEIELGKVIKTNVLTNQKVKRGDKVVLYVSRGKETSAATVPQLVGLTEAEANKKLELSGLKPGTVTYSYSDEFAKDVVISQSIKHEKVVASDTEVSYVLSKGKEPVKEYTYTGEVTITKEDLVSWAEAKNKYDDVSKTEIKITLSQDGKETVVLNTTNINNISKELFELEGTAAGTAKVIVYARYTYEVEDTTQASTEAATQKPTQKPTEATTEGTTQATTKAPLATATKTSEFVKIQTISVTLKKTEVK